ncbi:MAG TPA: AmmeMemoRadiSam system protein B [Desulforhopalus sp.]|nr:AmmeMemoRadiSam system protein B [Desulforhopalus sp.]
MRRAIVANRFYPGSKETLAREIDGFFETSQRTPGKALAVVSPHAGYLYSGALAAGTLAAVSIPESVIILGPNHQGRGAAIALSATSWQTPLGVVPVDITLIDLLLELGPMVEVDETAHATEHSLEVQLPFLQRLQPHLKIVPLVLSQLSFAECQALAASLAAAISAAGGDHLLVASSDMSHYESREAASRKDHLALAAIAAMDAEALYRTVFSERISMCGVIPVVVAILAAQRLGAEHAELIGYTDSGYVTGDSHQVVGYAGVVIG